MLGLPVATTTTAASYSERIIALCDNPFVLKAQDFLILMKLLAHRDKSWNVRRLSQELGLSYANAYDAIARLRESRAVTEDLKPGRRASRELIVHGGPYLFPGRTVGSARGIATAHALEPLRSRIVSVGSPTPVIPYAEGEIEGQGIAPFHGAVASAAVRDPALHLWVALFDALRWGRARERGMAADYLERMIDDD